MGVQVLMQKLFVICLYIAIVHVSSQLKYENRVCNQINLSKLLQNYLQVS